MNLTTITQLWKNVVTSFATKHNCTFQNKKVIMMMHVVCRGIQAPLFKKKKKKKNTFYWKKNHTLLFFTYKAVLEPRVSPAFAITYFCNHCNIRFENTSKYVDTLTLFSKNLNQRSLTPRWPLTPCLLRSHVWLYPRIIVSKSHDNYTSMYVDTVINFAKYHIHTYIHVYLLPVFPLRILH